ncbi:hypothetical protein SLOPH_1073 [Spraguea lophii 42_110]|uniref:Uncharacterized protein n=1 Tax=Spraguea lophii (strain 42_110) TaxID=1358809 RepID=S7XHU9_SPRLO|nr:hypothetical protein SLOPH_1073 [Spraguea lophii 42_110]
MKIIGIQYLIFNILLMLNGYYIKINALELDKSNIIVSKKRFFFQKPEIVNMNKELKFILSYKPGFSAKKTEFPCDLELIGFVIHTEDVLSLIQGMVCKVTVKNYQDTKINSLCDKHYYACFALEDNDIVKTEECFMIDFFFKNVKIYPFSNNKIDIDQTVKINGYELKLEERNYSSSYIANINYSLKLTKTYNQFKKISIMNIGPGNIVMQDENNMEFLRKITNNQIPDSMSLLKNIIRYKLQENQEDQLGREANTNLNERTPNEISNPAKTPEKQDSNGPGEQSEPNSIKSSNPNQKVDKSENQPRKEANTNSGRSNKSGEINEPVEIHNRQDFIEPKKQFRQNTKINPDKSQTKDTSRKLQDHIREQEDMIYQDKTINESGGKNGFRNIISFVLYSQMILLPMLIFA